jgi:hypothetical protein
MKNNSCDWHRDDTPYENYDEVYCPNCSITIELKLCDHCQKYFIDWEYDGDDLIAGARFNRYDDFCCDNCYDQLEDSYDRQDKEDGDYYWESGYGNVDSYGSGPVIFPDEIESIFINKIAFSRKNAIQFCPGVKPTRAVIGSARRAIFPDIIFRAE